MGILKLSTKVQKLGIGQIIITYVWIGYYTRLEL